jgi:hypothetical protein
MHISILRVEPLEGHSYINEGFNSTMKEQPKKISTLCDLYPLLV